MQPKVIFIPSFIATALARNNQAVADILNYDIVKKCISNEDILLMMSLNITETHRKLFYYRNVDEKYMGDLVESDSIYRFWEQSCRDENIEDLRSLYSMHILRQYTKQLDVRLFNPDLKPQDQEQIPYSMVDLTKNVYGVIVNPGYFPNEALCKQLINDIIKQMYKYNQQFEIAQTGLFRLYLDTID